MLYALLSCFVAFLAVLKIAFKLTNGMCRSNACLVGKTALITGGNSGIGYETALGLAARGCRVIIASRTATEKVASDICKVTGNANVVAKKLDLASLASVREFAADFLASENRLDILINNSGAAGGGNVLTSNGLQRVMQINHLSPFLLTHLLIPLLRKCRSSRIIFVSSMLAFLSKLSDVENLNITYKDPHAQSGLLIDFRVYTCSKLCNVIAARYFAKKLRGTGITSNALHPGVVNTQIYGGIIADYMPKFFVTMFYALLGFLLKDQFEGAQTTLHVAHSAELEHVTGKYFWDCTQFIMPPLARNRDLCKKVIDESISLVKLTKEEML